MDAKTGPFDKNYQQYENWFEKNEYVYKSELKAVRHFIPDNKKGLEVGVGSGKFAVPLGIQTGVEPSKEMRKLAEERGIEVYDAVGESLPFENDSFDFVLMVTTICFLTDIDKSFQELTSSPPVPIVTNEDSLKKLVPKLSYVLRNDSFGIRPSRPSRGCRMIRGQSISSSPI